MRNMLTGLVGFLGIVVVLAVAFAVFVRVAPSDPVRWHVDPVTVAPPGFPGAVLMRPEGGEIAGPVFAASPERLLAAFDAVVRDSPRVSVLAGSVAEGHVTYVARSALFGFPDYVSVRVLAVEGGGSRLAVFSRLRFGYDDMKVNARRLDAWLVRTGMALETAGV